MHSLGYLFLAIIWFSLGCEQRTEGILSAESKDDVTKIAEKNTEEPEEPIIVEVDAPQIPPAPGMAAPFYDRGGGGVRKRLPCENGTSDCNDHNPCSIDSCENDICIHVLDTSKDQFGDCEVDGHSCSLGKCIEDAGQIQCFEQRREFIEGELGCQDENVCTADSCIEMPLNREAKTLPDGNVIPGNTYQCIQELTTGLLCAAEGCLSGFCQQTGTGLTPEDPFVVSCVADQTAPANCPATGNPCTVNICDAVDGCVLENLPAETVCDAGACNTNGLCNGLGTCVGTPIDTEIACGESPDSCRAFSCDDTLGCVLITPANEGLACSNGDPCVMTETCTAGVCGGGAQVVCPDDNNVCTSNTCSPGTGCIYPPSAVVSCNDNNNCTNNDTCTNGACLGTLLDCAIEDNPCQVGFCDVTVDGGCSTIDFTGPYGAECATPLFGICSVGALMCVEGALSDPPMCQPLVSPGDKLEVCDNGLDDNCNGIVDECNCVPVSSTPRFVNPFGTDSGDCSSNGSACSTIAYAITQALAGDTIVISAGTYLESLITVNKNLHIFGQGQAVSIVDANDTGNVFIVNTGITASFCGLTVTDGRAPGGTNGGGFFLNGTSIVTITDSTISSNVGTLGGGVNVNGLGSLTLDNCLVEGNSGNLGGGVFTNGGTISIIESTIRNNTVGVSGAGIANQTGTLSIVRSTISGNISTSQAGGIFTGGPTTITNSTISGNTGTFGGGIFLAGLSNTISNTTITANSGLFGGGIYLQGAALNISGSIVANQIAGTDCNGAGIVDGGFNLDKDNTCTFSTSVPTFTLPPLANNGGPTQTHALVAFGAGTQAIDAGNTTCGVTTDQRGELKPVDYPGIGPVGQARCDIGAFEIQQP